MAAAEGAAGTASSPSVEAASSSAAAAGAACGAVPAHSEGRAQETRDYDTARRLLAESLAIERESGERLGLAANLEVYGRLAAAQGQLVRAVCLYGSASVLRESVGLDACELGWPDPEPHVDRLRAALGVEAFAEAWEEGRALTLDESLDYALGEAAELDSASSRRLHTHRA